MRLSSRLALVAGVPAGTLALLLIGMSIQGQGHSTADVGVALGLATTRLTTAQQTSLGGVTARMVDVNRASLLSKGQSLGLISAGLAGQSLVLDDDDGLVKVAKQILLDDDCIGIWILGMDGALRAGAVDTELKTLVASVQPETAAKASPANLLAALGKLPGVPTLKTPIILEKKTLGTVVVALSAAHLLERETATRKELEQVQAESLALLEQTRTSLEATLAASSRETTLVLGVAGAVSLLALIPLGLFLGRRIARPVVAAAQVLQAVARGDYEQQVDVVGRDELADLAQSLNATVVVLRDSHRRIEAQAAEAVAMNQAMQDLVAKMNRSAITTAQQADDASSNAQTVSARVQNISTAVTQMASAGNEISVNTAESARIARETAADARSIDARIRALGASTQDINAIVGTIDGIARSTKMLALNATIEASRAGEAGRGFTVVADEVKELAQQTVKATKDISSRITGIQTQVQDIMGDIARIAATVTRMDELQGSVAAAIEEQSATTTEITSDLAAAAQSSQEIAQAVAGVAETAKRVGSMA